MPTEDRHQPPLFCFEPFLFSLQNFNPLLQPIHVHPQRLNRAKQLVCIQAPIKQRLGKPRTSHAFSITLAGNFSIDW